jgi:hypothetical protein
MTREEIYKSLQMAPDRCKNAEESLHDKLCDLTEAQRELADAERAAILDDFVLMGKNERVREARLQAHTAAERVRVEELEAQVRSLKIAVKYYERVYEMLTKFADAHLKFLISPSGDVTT